MDLWVSPHFPEIQGHQGQHSHVYFPLPRHHCYDVTSCLKLTDSQLCCNSVSTSHKFPSMMSLPVQESQNFGYDITSCLKLIRSHPGHHFLPRIPCSHPCPHFPVTPSLPA